MKSLLSTVVVFGVAALLNISLLERVILYIAIGDSRAYLPSRPHWRSYASSIAQHVLRPQSLSLSLSLSLCSIRFCAHFGCREEERTNAQKDQSLSLSLSVHWTNAQKDIVRKKDLLPWPYVAHHFFLSLRSNEVNGLSFVSASLWSWSYLQYIYLCTMSTKKKKKKLKDLI